VTAHDYEIVFVDDGSTDGSLAEILQIREKDPKGQVGHLHPELRADGGDPAGCKEAAGDAVINISADLQDPVTLIPEMVETWQQGRRSSSATAPTAPTISWRNFIPAWPMCSSHGLAADSPGGFDFVLMDRKVMDVFNSIDVRHRFFQEICCGPDIELASSLRAMARTNRKSQYNFSKKLKNFLMQFRCFIFADPVHLACWADYFGVRAALQHYYRHKLVFWGDAVHWLGAGS